MTETQNSGLKIQDTTSSKHINTQHTPNSNSRMSHQVDSKYLKSQENLLPLQSKSINLSFIAQDPKITGCKSISGSYDSIRQKNQELQLRTDKLSNDLEIANRKNADLEVQNGELLQNNRYLEEELNKLRLVRLRLESELEEIKRLSRSGIQSPYPSKVDQLISEKSILTAELKKTIEELDQTKQEKIQVVSEYELKLSQFRDRLQNLQKEGDEDKLRYSTAINELQIQNQILENEVINLNDMKSSLLERIDRIKTQFNSNLAVEVENNTLQEEISNINSVLKSRTSSINSSDKINEQATKDPKCLLEKPRMELGVTTVLLNPEIESLRLIVSEKAEDNMELMIRSGTLSDISGLEQSAVVRGSLIKEDKDVADVNQILELQKIAAEQEEKIKNLALLYHQAVEECKKLKSKCLALEEVQQVKIRAPDNYQDSNSQPIVDVTLKEFSDKFTEEKGKLSNEISTLKATITKNNNKTVLLTTEIDRLHSVVEIITKELEQWRNCYTLEAKENDNRPTEAMFTSIEKEPLVTQVKSYKDWVRDLLNLISKLQKETEKLKKDLFNKSLQVDSHKNPFTSIENNDHIAEEFELPPESYKSSPDIIEKFKHSYVYSTDNKVSNLCSSCASNERKHRSNDPSSKNISKLGSMHIRSISEVPSSMSLATSAAIAGSEFAVNEDWFRCRSCNQLKKDVLASKPVSARRNSHLETYESTLR